MNSFEYHTWKPLEEPLRCGSCNTEVLELYPCYWDSKIRVGECCLIHSDELEAYAEPLCIEVSAIASRAVSVEGFVRELKAHVAQCPSCQPAIQRKEAGSEQGSATEKKGVA